MAALVGSATFCTGEQEKRAGVTHMVNRKPAVIPFLCTLHSPLESESQVVEMSGKRQA